MDISMLALVNGFRYELENCFEELVEQEKEFKNIKVPSDNEGWTLKILSSKDRELLENCIHKFCCKANSYEQIKTNQEAVELSQTIYLKYAEEGEKGRFFAYKSILCETYNLNYKNNIYVKSLQRICSLFVSAIQEFILYKLENDFDKFYTQSKLDMDFNIYDYGNLWEASELIFQSSTDGLYNPDSFIKSLKEKNMPLLIKKISSGIHPNDLLKYIENYNSLLFVIDDKKIYRELFKIVSKGYVNTNNLPRYTTAGKGRPKSEGNALFDKINWIFLHESALLCSGFIANLIALEVG